MLQSLHLRSSPCCSPLVPLVALLLLSAALPTSAQAQPAPNPDPNPHPIRLTTLDTEARLEDARNAFIFGDYEGIVQRLKPILDSPEALKSLSRLDQAEIYRFFGVGLLLKTPSEREAAADAFLELLKLQPDFTFSESVYPAPAIELLAEVRAAHPDLFPQLPIESPDTPSIVYIQREVVQHPAWPNLLPPLGQFQNGQEVRGWVFLIVESLALATNVSAFVVAEQLRSSNGLYTPNNADIADTAQNIQLTSFYIFIGVVALGVWDAFANWEPEAVQIRRLDAPPPELSAAPAPRTAPLVNLDPWSSPRTDAAPSAAPAPDTDLSGALLRLAFPF